MGIQDLPASKVREIAVGQAFLSSFNAVRRTRFELDEGYWNQEKDPSPDLRFIQDDGVELWGEVVVLGDEGEAGFRKAAFHARIIKTADYFIDLQGLRGFDLSVQPARGKEGLRDEQLRRYVFRVLQYAIAKAPAVRENHLRIDRRVDGSYHVGLFDDFDSLSIYAIAEQERARFGVLDHAMLIEAAKWIGEALDKKRNRRYGEGTHLLLDNQSIFIEPGEASELTREHPVIMPNYAGVWLVTLGNARPVVDLACLGN